MAIVIGIVFFILMFSLLGIFLNWFSRKTNTRFVNKFGRTVVDNTLAKSIMVINVEKTEEQIRLEEMLLVERIKLREEHEKQLKLYRDNLNQKANEKRLKQQREDEVYNKQLAEYEAREKEKANYTEETMPLRLLVNLPPIKLAQTFELDTGTVPLMKQQAKERYELRVLHANQIIFADTEEYSKFIREDTDDPVKRTYRQKTLDGKPYAG